MSTIILPHWEKKKDQVAVQHRRLIVTIDGPAGVGKSTSAKGLSAQLGYAYLDSGALYRAVAWKVKAARVNPCNLDEIEGLLSTTTLQLTSQNQRLSILVDAQEVSGELRSLALGQLASSVAAMPSVREWLLPIQRNFGAQGGLVAEGRDMGTRVFPYADVKFFLDADLDVRTHRRHQELARDELTRNWTEVRQNIADRDTRDRSRDVAPLVQAADSIFIDTSTLTVDEVVDRMMDVIATRL